MKPLNEKLKELEQARDAEEFSSSARAAYSVCIELLQAWLREADGWLEPEKVVAAFPRENERSMDVSKFVDRIRQRLLGTTQSQVKQEGKK